MQVTKGTWRMREQCVPGSLSTSPAQEPRNEATTLLKDGAADLFNFAVSSLNRQTAKLNPSPNFPAIQYLI